MPYFYQCYLRFQEVLKRVQFTARLTLEHPINTKEQVGILSLEGVKCWRCHPFYSGTSCLTKTYC